MKLEIYNMILYHLVVLLIYAVVIMKVQGDDPCTAHCICDDSKSKCLYCEMWYVRNDQGMCAQYVEKVLLKNASTIASGYNSYLTLSVDFYQQDLDIHPYTQDYYYYTVQYKVLGTNQNFADSKFYKHGNGDIKWIKMFAFDLRDQTTYVLRVALYRAFPIRGWRGFLDATDTVEMTTKSFKWSVKGQYEFMYSGANTLPPRSFAEAEHYCNTLGGNLASVTSVAENSFLSSFSQHWVGLYLPDTVSTDDCLACYRCAQVTNKANNTDCIQCASCRSKWQWTDGSPLQITFWHSHHPTSSRCTRMHNTIWTSYPCAYTDAFLCKRVNGSTIAVTSSHRTTSKPTKSTAATIFTTNLASVSSNAVESMFPSVSSINTLPKNPVHQSTPAVTSTQTTTSKATSATMFTTNFTSSMSSKELDTTLLSVTSTNMLSKKFGIQEIVDITFGIILLCIIISGVLIFCYIWSNKKDIQKLQKAEIYKTNDPIKPAPTEYLNSVSVKHEGVADIAIGFTEESVSDQNQYQGLYNSVVDHKEEKMYTEIDE